MMTKGDYQKIAKVIAGLPVGPVPGTMQVTTPIVSKSLLCEDMAKMLRADNPNFNWDKFMVECSR